MGLRGFKGFKGCKGFRGHRTLGLTASWGFFGDSA